MFKRTNHIRVANIFNICVAIFFCSQINLSKYSRKIRIWLCLKSSANKKSQHINFSAIFSKKVNVSIRIMNKTFSRYVKIPYYRHSMPCGVFQLREILFNRMLFISRLIAPTFLHRHSLHDSFYIYRHTHTLIYISQAISFLCFIPNILSKSHHQVW